MKEPIKFELPHDDARVGDNNTENVIDQEKVKKQENLKGALLEIKERGISCNVLFYLHQAGEVEMEKRLLEVIIKGTLEETKGYLEILRENYQEKIINFIVGFITHTPYNTYLYAQSEKMLERSYFTALAKLLATVFEISENSYFNASRLRRDLEDTVKADELLKTAREQQEKGIGLTRVEQMAKLIEFKQEIITAVETFLEEAKDDPALMINAAVVTSEVKSEIEGKLG